MAFDSYDSMGVFTAPPDTAGTTWTALSELDALLSESGIYAYPADHVADLRLRLVRDAVAAHLKHNPRYAAYAERLGFELSQVRQTADLLAVPLLPSALFKRDPALIETVIPNDSHVLYSTSSGTQGAISRVPRNNLTLMRFFGTLTSALREVIGLESFTRRVYHLGPSHDEDEHLWTAYAMAGAALHFESEFYVNDGVLHAERLLDDLHRANVREPIAIVGPPGLLIDMAAALNKARPLRTHPDTVVLAFGGWKRRSDQLVARGEFDQRLASAIGHSSTVNVRDAFNMVELNTVIMDCEHKRKHCPPWLHASARHPKTLAPVGPGRPGVLAYLDPTATSYPCFILSDDFGSVATDVACPCGRTGDVLSIERRITRVEGRGCALKLDALSQPFESQAAPA
jgi:long-chain-fatty-acid---luciferin-component ligase